MASAEREGEESAIKREGLLQIANFQGDMVNTNHAGLGCCSGVLALSFLHSVLPPENIRNQLSPESAAIRSLLAAAYPQMVSSKISSLRVWWRRPWLSTSFIRFSSAARCWKTPSC